MDRTSHLVLWSASFCSSSAMMLRRAFSASTSSCCCLYQPSSSCCLFCMSRRRSVASDLRDQTKIHDTRHSIGYVRRERENDNFPFSSGWIGMKSTSMSWFYLSKSNCFQGSSRSSKIKFQEFSRRSGFIFQEYTIQYSPIAKVFCTFMYKKMTVIIYTCFLKTSGRHEETEV